MRWRAVTLAALAWLVLPGCFFIGRARLADLPPQRSGELRQVTLHVDGQPVRVIAAQTGVVSIKGCHHEGCLPEGAPYPLRFLAILADPTLGARMPIWSYIIQHPQGVYVIDAGASPSYNEDASWAPDPVSGYLVRGFIRLDVEPSEALRGRLQALGVSPDDVRAVVLTHQHVDHTGGVNDLPRAEVWTSRAEQEAQRVIGALPWRWLSPQTRQRLADVEGQPRQGLPYRGVALTQDGRLEVLHTPGHTPGSLSVRLSADEGELWFIGDISFRARDIEQPAPTAGIHTKTSQVRALHQWLRERQGPRALLPAHDDEVPQTLDAIRAWPVRASPDQATP